MQNTLSAPKLAETEWGFGQDGKNDPVPIKPVFKSISGISLSGHAGQCVVWANTEVKSLSKETLQTLI